MLESSVLSFFFFFKLSPHNMPITYSVSISNFDHSCISHLFLSNTIVFFTFNSKIKLRIQYSLSFSSNRKSNWELTDTRHDLRRFGLQPTSTASSSINGSQSTWIVCLSVWTYRLWMAAICFCISLFMFLEDGSVTSPWKVITLGIQDDKMQTNFFKITLLW